MTKPSPARSPLRNGHSEKAPGRPAPGARTLHPTGNELSLVMPLFNESACLKDNFTAVKTYLASLNRSFEIIMVDDGSTDGTRGVVDGIVAANPEARRVSVRKNRGKGHAVKTGVLGATGRYVIFLDADLAVPPEFIGDCLECLKRHCPVVIGSRRLPRSAVRVPETRLRRILGEIFRRAATGALSLGVSDVTCGLKGFRRKAAFRIFSRSKIERWGYDAEVLFLARKLGYGIGEIPVDWYHCPDSKVKVASASFLTLIEILRIGYYYRTGRYDLEGGAVDA